MKALCCYCWQTCPWLPAGSVLLGTYQSVPDNLPACFAREVVEDGPRKRSTLLMPDGSWCSRSRCHPGPALAVALSKGGGELPCCCRPLASSLGGSGDSRWDIRALPTALHSGSGDRTGMAPSCCEQAAAQHKQLSVCYVLSRGRPGRGPRARGPGRGGSPRGRTTAPRAGGGGTSGHSIGVPLSGGPAPSRPGRPMGAAATAPFVTSFPSRAGARGCGRAGVRGDGARG